MKTEIVSGEDREALARAGGIIRDGGLVVFPTETVYGLGADALSDEAVAKIYAAKGRPSDNPLITHITDPAEAEKYCFTDKRYYALAEAFMPGPITVIMKSRGVVCKTVSAGLPTVSLRIPSHPVARDFIKECGRPIAAPSANLSGKPSPTKLLHVREDMEGKVGMIIDGGECGVGVESTIVKLCEDGSAVLLRPGAVTVEMLREVSGLGNIRIADAVLGKLREGQRPESPGMAYRHYAPRAPLALIEGDDGARLDYCRRMCAEDIHTLIICYNGEEKAFPAGMVAPIGPENDREEQARRLFSILRDSDDRGVSRIFAPLPDSGGVGLALLNRMLRAAAYRIIRV